MWSVCLKSEDPPWDDNPMLYIQKKFKQDNVFQAQSVQTPETDLRGKYEDYRQLCGQKDIKTPWAHGEAKIIHRKEYEKEKKLPFRLYNICDDGYLVPVWGLIRHLVPLTVSPDYLRHLQSSLTIHHQARYLTPIGAQGVTIFVHLSVRPFNERLSWAFSFHLLGSQFSLSSLSLLRRTVGT